MMRLLLCFFVFSFYLFFIPPSLAYAGIIVSPLIIDFSKGRSERQDVHVTNLSDTINYVEIKPFIVENPGLKNEKKVEIKNPRKLGLIVSPFRLAIPPHETKLVRLALTRSFAEEEQVYAVRFSPKIGELIPSKTNVKPDHIIGGIKVLVAYEGRVIVRPRIPYPNASITRKGKVVTITNTGNTYIKLANGQQCKAKKCSAVKMRGLFPQQRQEIKVPYETPVTVKIVLFDKVIKTIRSN
jgi:P pilus assembly chaperone PapD